MAEKVYVLGTILAVLVAPSKASSKRRESESIYVRDSRLPSLPPPPTRARVVTTERLRNQNIRVNKQEKNYEYRTFKTVAMITHHDNMNASIKILSESCV